MKNLAQENSQKAYDINLKTKKIGFCWTSVHEILDNIASEIEEVKEALQKSESRERLAEEIGDLYLGVIELCYYLKLEPDTVLANSLAKFDKRFKSVEEMMKIQGLKSLHGLSVPEIMELWDKAKKNGAAEED